MNEENEKLETPAEELSENKEEEMVETKQSEEVPDSENKKKSKKKIIIICSIVAVVLIGALITGYFLILKKDPVTNDSNPKTWKDVLLLEAKNGSLKEKLTDQIDDYNYRADDIDVMLLDIDSDDDMELIAYVEDEITEKDKMMVFEIDKKIKFSKDYEVLNEDVLAYAYNVINENMYWYITDRNNSKVVISLEDKEYTEEEFNMNFHLVAHQYKNEEIFDQSEAIELNGKSNNLTSIVNKIINKKFTNAEFLENNNTSKRAIEREIEDEKKEAEAKLEEEQKQLEEEQKKAEEEKQKQEEANKNTTTNNNSGTGTNSANIDRIVDETQNSDVMCAQAIQEFYQDENYTYYFSCQKSDVVKVIYTDGTMEKVAVALKAGHIKITDLDRFNISYLKEKNSD